MPGTLNLAIATSLNNVITDMIPAIKTACNVDVVVIDPRSSGQLADEITLQPVPAITPDIFGSSAINPMNQVVSAGMITANTSPVQLLRNSLVLIKTRAYGADSIISFGHVNNPNVSNVNIYLGSPSAPYKVPAGIYAREAFEYYGNLGKVDDAPNVTYMPTVTAVLNAVAGASAPTIGAVYITDANAFWVTSPSGANPVEIIAVAPPSVNQTIIYPFAQISTGANQAAAAKFMTFVQTQTAKDYFVKWGFDLY